MPPKRRSEGPSSSAASDQTLSPSKKTKPSSSLTTSAYESIANGGDLIIESVPLGPPNAPLNSTRFLVCSQVLFGSSPYFNAMFGPTSSFSEKEKLANKGEEITVITLKGDNPDALRVVFRILHGKHRLVKREMGVSEVFEVAVLADKYQLEEALLIWVELWASKLEKPLDEFPGCLEWMFVCWLFQLKEPLREGLERLLAKASNDAKGELVFLVSGAVGEDGKTKKVEKYHFDERIPPKFTGTLKALRSSLIASLRTAFATLVASYTSALDTNRKYIYTCPLKDKEPRVCHSFQLGDLILFCEGWNLQKDSFWSQSITKIEENFEKIMTWKMTGFSGEAGSTVYKDCSWMIKYENIRRECKEVWVKEWEGKNGVKEE